jgi:hypothetical protein
MLKDTDVFFGPKVSDVNKITFVKDKPDVTETESDVVRGEFCPVDDKNNNITVA